MIISHRHKFIFFAVPKTGTHAIRFALRDHLDEQDEEQVNLFVKRRFSDATLSKVKHGHLSCELVKSVIDEKIWKQYFKFAYVRNPYDRFISYCFFINRQNKSFAKNPLPHLKEIFKTQQARQNILFRSQSSLLCDAQGNTLVDFVAKYEDFQNQFNMATARIGLPPQILDHVNASIHDNWSVYYDEELKEMVSSFYQADFENFGYRV